MKQLLAVVFVLFASPIQAQSAERVTRESFVYSDYLREVRSPDSLARLTYAIQAIDQLPGDSLPASYFSRGRYRLRYFRTLGWGEQLGRPRTKSDRNFVSNAAGKLVTSQEIFRLLGMHGNDSTVLRQYPLVIGREDTYNRRWTPVARAARYLVLRYVWSYPNGNFASGYSEQLYYFERVN